ncbi:uncharacterized protein N0V89_012358 [Didymosphaeria variabile]|uniref:Uncharacterized protein n=1 Tax=Didymosphaeria variabile TaxID=1932322 RepID=A0A9W8X915_9PLEO|nr:uncharacterized protein N0V89_012358 [Didymosphaeria variabile]KAJ4344614.1 hypothetical protein N0V89_012358 [Didymosphaeria variabile]
MAPPHTSKKTSTTSQATSRRGTRQVKQHVENYELEAEAIDDDNDAVDMDIDNAEVDELAEAATTEASQDGSQPNSVQELLRSMQADQHKRNEIRKKSVYKAYKEAHASTQEAITSHFDEHEMARLKELLKMKAQIEATMAEKLVALRKDYVYHSKALEMVVEHRMKQLN